VSLGRLSWLRRLVPALLLCAALAAAIGACGGAEAQDENEPSGTWKVDVISASFPGRQHLAQRSTLRIAVKNADSRPIPNLAVTVDGFHTRIDSPRVSDRRRPIWVIDEAPDNSISSYTNTWSVGEVDPGDTRTLDWKVSAVRPGAYLLRWRVSAGVDGNAKARLPDGTVPKGSFNVRVADEPRPARVD
jgi:hypothetical protein